MCYNEEGIAMPKIKEVIETTAAAIPFAERNLPDEAREILNQVEVREKARSAATKRKDTRPRARAK